MSKYVYEFDENPAKLLGSDKINRIATKITVDGKVCRNRYGKTDFEYSKEEWHEVQEHAERNVKYLK